MATIKKRGNSYLIRCYDGYDQTGRQIERTMTWKIPAGMTEKKAEREARHQAELFEERVRTGQSAEQKIKFADFCDLWMKDYAETQLRPKTVNRYRELLERIKPALGSIYLDRLRPTHLTAFYRELAQVRKTPTYTANIDLKAYLKEKKITQVKLAEQSGVCTCTIRSIIIGNAATEETAQKIAGALNTDLDKLFSPVGEPEYLSGQTILHYHRLISVILQTAVEWQYIPTNAAERVKPPKAESTEAVYLDDKQAIRLLELLEDQPVYYRTAVTVLLFTGMRRGELMGLVWSDIDFDNNTITIQRSMQYLPDTGVFISDTKTKSSRRVIKAPASAIQSLKAYRAWQKKIFLSIGQPWGGRWTGIRYPERNTHAPGHADKLVWRLYQNHRSATDPYSQPPPHKCNPSNSQRRGGYYRGRDTGTQHGQYHHKGLCPRYPKCRRCLCGNDGQPLKSRQKTGVTDK